jgi:hypothetical protein
MNEAEPGQSEHTAGSFASWLAERDLLRGPFLFVDYWANVLRLEGGVPEAHVRLGLVDRSLFRVGLDRPDLEVPRLRQYIWLFLLGPFLLPFRSFRRIGKYRIRFRHAAGEDVLRALEPYRLDLMPGRKGRVDVRGGDQMLAEDVVDPRLITGFSSLFYAAYKLPMAAIAGAVLTLLSIPLLARLGWINEVREHYVLIGFPVLTGLLWLLFRDWIAAVLGAVPALLGTWMVGVLQLNPAQDWTTYLQGLVAIVLLYLAIDWFFLPRPVPPVLMLYTRDGPGKPYERRDDSPYWLDGEVYWVWRYLMLTPAELNKFWERDWERVELWIRADGERAGALEWVVTDGHYRELWVPAERLASPEVLRECNDAAVAAVGGGSAGTWLVEVDANPIFHTPFFRLAAFLPESGRIPVRGVWYALLGLWRRARNDDPDDFLPALDRARVREGEDLLDDVPEFVAGLTARHLLKQPWSYWRYPYGAGRRREQRLYSVEVRADPPLAADPALQVKTPEKGVR